MDELCIDNLSGIEFENYLFNLFKNLGYEVEITPASNDYGADLIISKDKDRTVIQAKRYSNTVGISAIQEIIGAKNYYRANKCMVVTNNYFTPNAIELSEANNVELWDRDILIKMITLSLDTTCNSENYDRKLVFLHDILNSDEYKNTNFEIPLVLGKSTNGKIIIKSIDEMPHLLIAGSTGTGKSICIHALITSILYRPTQDDVKLLLIDTKVVELSIYNGIPNLLIPVVTEPKKAVSALNWAIAEMENRYKLFTKNNVRDITSYNEKFKNNEEEKLSKIVIIIDELADLMMVSAQEIENCICRLAQMARAAGIYLIVTTQIPSIANVFKNSFPSRISFRVFSQSDSRIILDTAGAEKLLNEGDMLFYSMKELKPIRIQGAFISNEEIKKVVNHFINKHENNIVENIQNEVEVENIIYDVDELLPKAIYLVIEEGQASISLLQRKLKIGYARAARIVDEMEDRGIVGGYEGSKPRKVLINKEDIGSLHYFDYINDLSYTKTNLTSEKKLNISFPILKITISFFLWAVLSLFIAIKVDNAFIGLLLLFFIAIVSFKLGSWITNKLFKIQRRNFK